MKKETIEIPLVKATYEELQQVICELQVERIVKDKEIERLSNIINKTRRILGEYKHYSTPDEEQNAKNETIVDEAYEKLHSNLKEGK